MLNGPPWVGPPWNAPPTVCSFNGRVVHLQVPDTRALVDALLTDEQASGLHVVLELVIPEDRGRVYDLICERGSTASLAFFHRVADRLARVVLGVERWSAEFLWRRTIAMWTYVDGDLLSKGVELLDLPPARATAVTLAWWRSLHSNNVDGWKQFTREMEKEPRREVIRQAEAAAGQMDAGTFAAISEMGRSRSAVPTGSPDTIS